MRSAMDGPHVGIGRCVGLEGQARPFESQCCWVRPGSQKLIVTGGIGDDELGDETLRHLAKVVFLTVSSHIEVVKHNLRALTGNSVDLIKTGHDVHMHLVWEANGGVKHGRYQAAMAASLLSLMIQRRPRDDTAILGALTCTGRLSVANLEVDVVALCYAQGIRRMIVAEEQGFEQEVLDQAAVVEEDGEPLLRFIRHTFVWNAVLDLF